MFAASVDEIIILKWILENMIGWCAVYWVVCSVLDGVQCIHVALDRDHWWGLLLIG